MSFNYTYNNQRAYIPKAYSNNIDSNYSNSQPNSPLSYSEDSEQEPESESKHYQYQDQMTQINNKKELINIIILVLSDNLNTKFNLNLNNIQINSLKKLIIMLIIKNHLSLSNITKNALILEKILLRNSNNSISFNLLKRMVLISFIIGDNGNLKSLNKWHKLTGLPISVLKNDYFNFTNQFNIISEISEIDVLNFNKNLKIQVKNYVKVV
ncbi:hypothetical protein C6P40_002074 [Pichia californica]|uniref:Uncharacterized protein n=1 Tax=Pichia californica TaxID=460514 RepID=A0A9P7BF20_9ASCO|nr:hypothetical protein C6P42_005221 [[Candida] californica]KAG0687650.1 hypothetical protein C6P40_002074 [[Candida] californica]